MLMVSTQWIAIFQYLQEVQSGAKTGQQVGFVGGNDEQDT